MSASDADMIDPYDKHIDFPNGTILAQRAKVSRQTMILVIRIAADSRRTGYEDMQIRDMQEAGQILSPPQTLITWPVM